MDLWINGLMRSGAGEGTPSGSMDFWIGGNETPEAPAGRTRSCEGRRESRSAGRICPDLARLEVACMVWRLYWVILTFTGSEAGLAITRGWGTHRSADIRVCGFTGLPSPVLAASGSRSKLATGSRTSACGSPEPADRNVCATASGPETRLDLL